MHYAYAVVFHRASLSAYSLIGREALVAWCSVAPRETYRKLGRDAALKWVGILNLAYFLMGRIVTVPLDRDP